MRQRGFLRARTRPAHLLLVAAAGLAVALGVLPGLATPSPETAAPLSGTQAIHVTTRTSADDVTASGDVQRTGWDQSEAGMGPAAVKSFTQLFKTSVNGQVYAQPLVVGSTVIVATEKNYVYGLDAATGAIQWKTHLGQAFVVAKSSNHGVATCHDLVPDVGVTGTPVYDPATGDAYMFAMARTDKQHWFLFGVNATTGHIDLKKEIWGRPSNDHHLYFSAQLQGERVGALLLDGVVYGAFASHCDRKPYAGYVAGVNVSTHAFTLWTDENGVAPNQAGIWQSGGGLMSDGSGRIFLTSGNGISPANGKGTSPPGQLAESVVRLAVNSTGSLSAKDFFSPTNAPALDAADTDFGSGGPVALPFGTTTYPNVLLQAGKDGRLFMLNRDGLGGRGQGTGGTNGDLSVTTPYGGLWGHPAVFGDTTTLTGADYATANDYVYYLGKSDFLRVFKVRVNASDKPTLSDVANSSVNFAYTSGSPVVTSNGTDATTPVVWVVYAGNENGGSGQLEAYDVSSAALAGCTGSSQCKLSPIWSAPIGTAAKFVIPATSNGRVYVGTRAGAVYGFGAAPPAAPVATAPASFAQTGVSSTTSKTVSVTANAATTITSVTSSTGASSAAAPGQFTVGTVTVTKKGSSTPVPVHFPVALAKGDKLNTQVRFAPAGPGGTVGSLTIATQSARFATVNVPLTGTGTIAGLYAQPGDLSFPLAPDQGVIAVPVGISIPQLVDITNGSTATQTVRSVQAPSGPFSAVGLPAPGTKIRPGQSLAAQISFTPTRPGPVSDSFTITTDNGPDMIVTLAGVGAAPVSKVTPSHRTLYYGSVPVGQSRTENVHVTNTGNQPSTLSSGSLLAAPFHAEYRIPKNLPFNPGYDATIPVRFTPTRTGTFTTHYTIIWHDLLGTHHLTVTLTGRGT
jgi:PQQ-like domain/Abnormal spindle-like microcephaly-assoc'd, ASPM-SPD-2-Hydin